MTFLLYTTAGELRTLTRVDRFDGWGDLSDTVRSYYTGTIQNTQVADMIEQPVFQKDDGKTENLSLSRNEELQFSSIMYGCRAFQAHSRNENGEAYSSGVWR